MNKTFLIGRLTREPELRYTASNIPTTTFTLAVTRNFTNQAGERESDFINIVVWRKQAENAKDYLTKGSKVAIEGRIQTRNYDGQDGKKVYVTEVVADSIEFLESKKETAPEEKTEAEILKDVMEDKDPYADFGEQIEITDSDLPF